MWHYQPVSNAQLPAVANDQVQAVQRSELPLQDEFEATNACVYEMEKRLEERFVEVRADVSLASAECKQQTVTEIARTSKLQLDSLQDRFNNRLLGKLCHPYAFAPASTLFLKPSLRLVSHAKCSSQTQMIICP